MGFCPTESHLPFSQRLREMTPFDGHLAFMYLSEILESSLSSYLDIWSAFRSLGNRVPLRVCDTTYSCEMHGGLRGFRNNREHFGTVFKGWAKMQNRSNSTECSPKQTMTTLVSSKSPSKGERQLVCHLRSNVQVRPEEVHTTLDLPISNCGWTESAGLGIQIKLWAGDGQRGAGDHEASAHLGPEGIKERPQRPRPQKNGKQVALWNRVTAGHNWTGSCGQGNQRSHPHPQDD